MLDGELDVGHDLAAPALAHQQRSPFPRGLDRERRSVDEAHARVERIDPATVPHQVEEGEARHDHDHPWRHGVEPAPGDTLPLAGTKLSVDDGGAVGGAMPAWPPRIWKLP